MCFWHPSKGLPCISHHQKSCHYPNCRRQLRQLLHTCRTRYACLLDFVHDLLKYGPVQAGIPLVMYLREDRAEMVELPENSCHAFITYGSVHSRLPCLKVLLQPCRKINPVLGKPCPITPLPLEPCASEVPSCTSSHEGTDVGMSWKCRHPTPCCPFPPLASYLYAAMSGALVTPAPLAPRSAHALQQPCSYGTRPQASSQPRHTLPRKAWVPHSAMLFPAIGAAASDMAQKGVLHAASYC